MKSWIQWRMQRRGPGGPGPPLFLDQTENIFFGDRATILSKGAIHSTKIQTGPTGKRDHLKRWTRFFETFPVGPNRSIEFWTEISGNFGWMDRALGVSTQVCTRAVAR